MKNLIFSLTMLVSLTFTSCNVKKSSTQNISVAPASDLASLPMRWNHVSLPLTVKISDSLIADMTSYSDDVDGHNLVEQMEKQWNNADGSRNYYDISVKHTTTNKAYSDLRSYSDSEIGIYKHAQWFPESGFLGVLAITSYFGRNYGSYIEMIHGDIIINNRDFSFTFDSADQTSAYDLPSVLLHELGHLVGIKHTQSSIIPSVMQPSIGHSDVKRTLYTHDRETITSLYNSTFALSAQPLALTAADEDDPPKYVQGYIELHADGKCVHKQNGKIIDVHHVNIKK